ncbi:hypothetical protein [Acrocarpospora pleiomorpha]|uniref:pPIWI_RE_Z domain-containing protein n=1 Tax=Acrocarpospora pleiomorpha TaxID=90975 RepID=UPI0031D816BB
MAEGLKHGQLKALCEVEIGLFLQQRFMESAPAVEAWALFSGYPFAKAWGAVTSPQEEQTLRIARYTLWGFRRREAWLDALEQYQKHDSLLRGYDVPDASRPARRCAPWLASHRWRRYAELLASAPPFEGDPLTVAEEGRHSFQLGRDRAGVTLPKITGLGLPLGHDLALPRRGEGFLTLRWDALERTAVEMDAIRYGDWEGRLSRIRLFTSRGRGFSRDSEFTIAGILNMLGIVGVGKSTIRDILTVHLVKQLDLRVTVVVGDVAELLKLIESYNTYARDSAVPVIGVSSRELHAQRLHRRQSGRVSPNLLAHDDPAFDHLSTSCVINALRWVEDPQGAVLPYGEAPCTHLRADKGGRRVCPFWAACPRHQDEQHLVRAPIWVATPQSLISASVPWAQNAERIRYLELACRRSDLIIIDEADRVQMQMDQLFAPAVPLEGSAHGGSFLFNVNQRKLSELAEGRQEQLSSRDVETWSAAVNTVTAATNRLYAMLVNDPALRGWVRGRYFNSWTLQLRLIEERYPPPAEGVTTDPDKRNRRKLTEVLDEFRDNPFGDKKQPRGEPAGLVRLVGELLHTEFPARTRERLIERMVRLFQLAPIVKAKRVAYEQERDTKSQKGTKNKKNVPPSPDDWLEDVARRFEFTLLLSALEPKLTLMNVLWPRVEAILRLGFNQMYGIPRDYAPMVPESPMGNVLGFQFLVDGPDKGGVRSGELRYFRCSGVGRELLRAMPELPTVDGRPGTNVLLLSGTSWAGESSRYHIAVPVGAILKPHSGVTATIGEKSEFRMEFLFGRNGPLTVSGAKEEQRPEILKQMATELGADNEEGEGSKLLTELASLEEERRHIMLLVGSYAEATLVADTLHAIPAWKGRVIRLAADDDELDSGGVDADGDEYRARVLRRGDIDTLARIPGEILVAPLLAVERGHNILNEKMEAAIGSVYFLARPNPRPDDLSLAIHAINDWVVRAMESGDFSAWVRGENSLDNGALKARGEGRSHWYRLLARSLAWSRLGDDRVSVTWDMLVLIWQVIGRLLRGGVPARVVFVDAAFAPNTAARSAIPDTPETSLLHSMREVLEPYFLKPDEETDVSPHDREIVQALFRPLKTGLDRCLSHAKEGTTSCPTP